MLLHTWPHIEGEKYSSTQAQRKEYCAEKASTKTKVESKIHTHYYSTLLEQVVYKNTKIILSYQRHTNRRQYG